MKKFLKLVFINYAMFCGLLIALELSLQVYYYYQNGQFIFSEATKHSELFEIHPFSAGRLKKSTSIKEEGKKISTTKIHTRSTGADLDNQKAYRIGILGGSTAFCVGLTDKNTWPALLQTQLGTDYTVINYGLPGYSTAENIMQLALMTPKDSLDLVIVYSGWNDIKHYHDPHFTDDYYIHGMAQFTNLKVNEKVSKNEQLRRTFALYKFTSELKSSNTKRQNAPISTYNTSDDYVDNLYKRNLETLRALSARFGAKILFIPQVMNNDYYLNKAGRARPWTKHIKNEAMPALMEHFNTIMLDVCDMNSNSCFVIKELMDIEWEEKHFIDDGHFSIEGSNKMEEIIRDYLVEHIGI